MVLQEDPASSAPHPGSEADRFVKALFTPTAAVRKRAQEMALAAPLGDQ